MSPRSSPPPSSSSSGHTPASSDSSSPKSGQLPASNYPQQGVGSSQRPPYNLTDESRKCLRNLAAYTPPRSLRPRKRVPADRRVAVLVALFIGRMGNLYVLLNQRSEMLRTYAGDTCLPGGKAEPSDRSMEDTARREAFEEIGLTLDKKKVPLLCKLEPFLVGNYLVVTPVVVLILDNTLRPLLNRTEVTSLFSHPLRSFLSTEAPSTRAWELYGHEHQLEYHTYTDVPWIHGRQERESGPGNARTLRFVRMHRFLTGREAGGIKPVYGLTAAILIRVASIGFACEPDFELYAPGQPSMPKRIDAALRRRRIEDGVATGSRDSGTKAVTNRGISRPTSKSNRRVESESSSPLNKPSELVKGDGTLADSQESNVHPNSHSSSVSARIGKFIKSKL